MKHSKHSIGDDAFKINSKLQLKYQQWFYKQNIHHLISEAGVSLGFYLFFVTTILTLHVWVQGILCTL